MIYKQAKSKCISIPIEYKEINPSDFADFQVETEKIIITPDSDGYLRNQLRTHIQLEEKNTVVINAAVGQGKSYECINIVYKT